MVELLDLMMADGVLDMIVEWDGDTDVSFRTTGCNGVYTQHEYQEAILRWVGDTFPGRRKVAVVIEYDPRQSGLDRYEWAEAGSADWRPVRRSTGASSPAVQDGTH